jgi:hypothetical protein
MAPLADRQPGFCRQRHSLDDVALCGLRLVLWALCRCEKRTCTRACCDCARARTHTNTKRVLCLWQHRAASLHLSGSALLGRRVDRGTCTRAVAGSALRRVRTTRTYHSRYRLHRERERERERHRQTDTHTQVVNTGPFKNFFPCNHFINK